MDFRPLNDSERRQLISALRGNAESDRAILMDRRDTSLGYLTHALNRPIQHRPTQVD